MFSTKGRVPCITSEIEASLHAYMGGILRELGCAPLIINGTSDHVHLLVRFPSKLSVSDMMRHVKSRSTKWMQETMSVMRDFAWQEGYGGFTVSQSMVETVRAYIMRQKDHHRTQDFKIEYIELLRRHAIEFEPSEVFER